ncbi:PEGA domain-containing protein [Candidatus Dojkabacteria bacterium]|nr:PEGA domain-containing protein [Candidatus Dojkabacteria bacterium]
MLKKISLTILLVSLLVLLGVWSPWNKLDISFLEVFGLKQSIDYAGLQVYSLSGEVQVEIDGELAGNVTVEGSPLEIIEIEPGEHLVSLSRVGEDTTNDPIYHRLNRVIRFEEGVNTVIAYELGPSKEFSEGYIITTTQAMDPGNPKLNLTTNPDDAQITINDLDIGVSPLSNYAIDTTQNYQIEIKKENYETIVFDLLPQDEIQRDLLKEYDINVEVNLFQIPIEVIEVNEQQE